MKHLFTALLLLCTTVASAHDFEVYGIYYNITDATNKTVSVTYKGNYYNSYNEYTSSVVIPKSVAYNGTTYSVTSIGDWAFRGCTGLTSIEIPNSVTSIGDDAFYDCTGLTSIVIGNSVTSTGYRAFCGCTGLTSIEIPNSVTSIGDDAFEGCSGLTSVTIPNSVTSIGDDAFYDCTGLTSIEIPNSVTSIGWSAFEGCTGLTSITIPNSVTSIGNEAFSGCTGLTSVEFNAENCTTMGSNEYPVFSNCTALSTVTFGENVKTIPNYAFYYCTGLTSITIPNSVTSIKSRAFYRCTGLTSVVIGNSVTSIGNYSFRDCKGLKTIYNFSNLTFSEGSSSNGYVAYYADKVYNAPNGSIEGDFIFGKPNDVNTLIYYLGNTDNLVLPADYKGENYVIDSAVFKDNTVITSVTIPNSVTYIGNQAFYNCSELNEVHISDLSAWCNIAFASADANPLYYAHNLYLNGELVTVLVIPDNVTNIRDYAFYDCTGLTSVVIGNSATSIGNAAFENCTELKTVINFSNLTFSKGSSNNGYVAYYATKVINAPNAVIDGDYIWCNLNGVNTLAYYLGEDEELVLPVDYNGEIYVIGDDAFNGCTGLRSIEIPNSVTSIGDEAFSGCTGLEKVCINDLAAWYGIDFGSADANPLYYAKNLYLNGELLTELSIPAEIAEVKDYAFYNCNGVTNIDIVDGVKSIGNSAFYGCDDLETLYISNTIESIGDYAFAECNNILDIKIGSKKAITASENIFSSDAYNNACLYVPTGRKDFYAKTSPWSNFIIREMDFTGIEELKSENGKVKTIYDLNGRAIENPTNGVYIINGKKVLVK